MRLPNEPERFGLYRNLERECASTREQRAAQNARMRALYLDGADGGGNNLINSLYEFVEDSSALLYSPDSVRFWPALPPHYGDVFLEELTAMRDEMHRLWHKTGPTLIFDAGVQWAHVYGGSVFKNIACDGDPALALVPDPSDFGVWNEAGSLATQEAVCHWYDYPLARFERLIAHYPPAERARMLEAARNLAGPPRASNSTGLPPAVGSLIINAASAASVTGAIGNMPDITKMMAVVREPCVPMAELWVKDDLLRAYRKVALFPPTSDVLWQPGQKEEYGDAHPFHLLTLDDVPGYLWGLPLIGRLIRLDQWENARWADIDLFVKLQMEPPYFLRGIQGRDGEKAERVRTPRGEISSNDPTAEIKSLAPPAAMLPDAFALIDGIQKQRRRVAGLPSGSSGEGQPNVRSGDQSVALGSLSSPRLRRRAGRVEATLADIATQMLRMQQRRDGTELITRAGTKFLMAQVPDEFGVSVAAHSASPLYAEQIRGLAFALHKSGTIDAEELLEMAEAPFAAEHLVPVARRLQKAKAEQAQIALGIEKAKADAKTKTADASVLRAQKS